MIGTWDISVTLRKCDTGASITTVRAMNTFASGGTLIETGARQAPQSGLGHGTWRHVGGQNYSAILRFLRVGNDGVVAGMDKITRHIELSADGDAFLATTSVEVFDTDDGLVQTSCATEHGKRLE